MIPESTASLPQATLGPLRPCPFCGGAATLEPDPWTGESFQIACANGACRVSPSTEYLLLHFGDELREAWNGRRESCH